LIINEAVWFDYFTGNTAKKYAFFVLPPSRMTAYQKFSICWPLVGLMYAIVRGFVKPF